MPFQTSAAESRVKAAKPIDLRKSAKCLASASILISTAIVSCGGELADDDEGAAVDGARLDQQQRCPSRGGVFCLGSTTSCGQFVRSDIGGKLNKPGLLIDLH
jgi:hypothetical protein